MNRRPSRLERIIELQTVLERADWIEPFFRKRIGRILGEMRRHYHLQPGSVADSLRQSNALMQLSDQLMTVMQQALAQRRPATASDTTEAVLPGLASNDDSAPPAPAR